MLTTFGLSLVRNWKLVLSLLSISTFFYIQELSLSDLLRNGNRYVKMSVYKESTDIGRQLVNQRSGLNKHLWYGYCQMDLATLCHHPFFPKVPDEMALVPKLNTSSPTTLLTFHQRVFGYVIPPSTGRYRFAVSSKNSYSELWLSFNSNWESSRQIALNSGVEKALKRTICGDFDSYQHKISAEINLVRGQKYFIEILHWKNRHLNKTNHLQVAWQTPGSLVFQVIDGKHTIPLLGDNSVPPCKACRHLNKPNKYLRAKPLRYEEVTKSNESCFYKPSYIVRRRLTNNEAIYSHFHPTNAFPHHEFRGREASVPRPQQPLGEDEAKRAVALYMEHIEQKFPE